MKRVKIFQFSNPKQFCKIINIVSTYVISKSSILDTRFFTLTFQNYQQLTQVRIKPYLPYQKNLTSKYTFKITFILNPKLDLCLNLVHCRIRKSSKVSYRPDLISSKAEKFPTEAAVKAEAFQSLLHTGEGSQRSNRSAERRL